VYNAKGVDVPTVFIIHGVRFYFYSREETRSHIHVAFQDREAKIWLDTFDVAYNHGFKLRELRRILLIVREYEKTLKKAWDTHFR
jgi:hypothetical protein